MLRVGQNRIYTPYITVYSVISLPKIPYIHRIYMVLANPTHAACMCTHMFLHRTYHCMHTRTHTRAKSVMVVMTDDFNPVMTPARLEGPLVSAPAGKNYCVLKR